MKRTYRLCSEENCPAALYVSLVEFAQHREKPPLPALPGRRQHDEAWRQNLTRVARKKTPRYSGDHASRLVAAGVES